MSTMSWASAPSRPPPKAREAAVLDSLNVEDADTGYVDMAVHPVTVPPADSTAALHSSELDTQCALKQLHSSHGLVGSSGPAAAPVTCSFPMAGMRWM